jgi:cell division protein FtsQ
MAGKRVPTTPGEELEAERGSSIRSRSFDESPLDARMLDLDDEIESPFLRGQKRVSVRRGPLPRKAATRVKHALVLSLVLGAVTLLSLTLYRYTTQSWRFRIDSGDDIEISGSSNVSRAQVMEVMGGDLDRNIFFVSLADSKKQLEEIPWVQTAVVMRFLPKEIRVVVHERTPVAFVAINSHIALIDRNGVVMDYQPGQQANYSFPVIVGMPDNEPASSRAARMKLYMELIQQLDSGGAHYSHDLSDIDLSDPDDVKATVSDPHGAVLVHLGTANFLERFKIYVAHVQEWRAQFLKLESVDLRYEHQVIVNPDPPTGDGRPASAASSQSAEAKGAAKRPAAEEKKIASRHKGKKHT